MNTQELRQTVNTLEVLGYLKEVELSQRSKVSQGETIDYITGKLTIWISDNREITLSVPYVKKLNNNGEVTKKYLTLVDLINKKHASMASLEEVKASKRAMAQQMYQADPSALEVALNEIEQLKPAVINVWSSDPAFAAKLAPNDFWSEKESKVIEGRAKPELGFANITIKDNVKEQDFYAKGRVEMFVTGVQEEMKNGEETGNAIVKGYGVAYGSKAFPVEVVAVTDGDFSFAQLCLSQLSQGMTVIFFYDYMAGKTVTEIVEGGSFGRGQVKVVETSFSGRLETLGGEIVEVNALDEDLMRQAVTVRKTTYFDEIKQQYENRAAQPKPAQQGFGGTGFGGANAGGFGGGFGASTQPAMPARPNPSSLF